MCGGTHFYILNEIYLKTESREIINTERTYSFSNIKLNIADIGQINGGKMSMKKKIIIATTICIIVALLSALLAFIFSSPLKKYDFSDCSVGVYAIGREDILDYLTDEQTERFVYELNQIEFVAYTPFADTRYAGAECRYEITFSNNEKISVAIKGPYFIINDMIYKCEWDSLEGVSDCSVEVLNNHYPVNKKNG